MATIAQDTFTEAVDVNISLHLSDTPIAASSWDMAGDGSEPVVEADDDAVRGATDSNRWARHKADVGDDDMDVSCDAKTTNTSNRRAGCTGRCVSGENGKSNSYNLFVEGDGSNIDVLLDKLIAGVETNLGSYALNGTQGTYYTLKLALRTNSQTCYVNGTSRITASDTNLTGNNFGGVRIKRNDANVRVDNFLLESVASGTNYTSTLTETVTDTDTIKKATTRTLSETVVDTDTMVKATTRILSETLSLVDTLIKGPGKVLTETATVSDSIIKGAGKLLTETLTLADSALRAITRTLSDTITLIDTENASTARILSETLSVLDSLLKATSRTLSETVTDTDSISKGPGKNLLETFSLVDSLKKDMVRILSETVTATDSFTKGFVKILSETLTLVDSVSSAFIRYYVDIQLVKRLVALLAADATISSLVGSRIYIAHPSTIQDYDLPAVFIKLIRGRGRYNDRADIDGISVEINILGQAVGLTTDNIWNDLVVAFDAIDALLHRAGIWSEATPIKVIESTLVSQGPIAQLAGGIISYPSTWRFMATL